MRGGLHWRAFGNLRTVADPLGRAATDYQDMTQPAAAVLRNDPE